MRYLKKYNESLDNNSLIEIIEEAFFIITDTYPLEIKLDVIPFIKGYAHPFVNINLKFSNDFLSINRNDEYKDLDLLVKQSDIYNDLITKCRIAINNLKNDFEYKYIKIELNGDYAVDPRTFSSSIKRSNNSIKIMLMIRK